MRFILSILSLFLFHNLTAQDDWRLYGEESNTKFTDTAITVNTIEDSIISEGSVTIYADPRIDSLISILDKNPPVIKGYRVEIFFGKRKLAENVKSEFLKYYDEWPIYIVWQQPNFKVQIGDFMTKLQAEKTQQDIRAHYPHSYIAITDIKGLE